MEIYDPKRGHYVEENDIEQVALDIFGGSKEREFQEEVVVEGEERTVNGIIIDPKAPVYDVVAIGEVDMGSRKNWVYIDIEQVPDDELAKLLQGGEFDMQDAATQKNRFITEVTGYEVEHLSDKEKKSSRGYDSLSELA